MKSMAEDLQSLLASREVRSGIYCANHPEDEMIRYKHAPSKDYDPDKHGELVDGYALTKRMCVKCEKARLDREFERKVNDEYLKSSKYGKYHILKNQSLVGKKSLWYARFDTFKVNNNDEQRVLNNAQNIARDYLNGKVFNTVFTGDAGRGKSHLAMAILQQVNEAMKEHKFSTLFINTNELVREIQTSWKYEDKKHEEERLINLLRNVDLLVLDDFGTEAGMKGGEAGNWIQGVIYNILNVREGNTIITTNLQGKALKSTYNDKLVSRILENSSNSIVKFDGIIDKRR